MEKIKENIQLVTADGTPLKISLARAQRRSKIVAFMMVFPLLLFITIAFIGPIADMLMLSIDNTIVKEILPKSTETLQSWDEYSGELPDEAVFAAIVADIKKAKAKKQHTKIGSRFNYESSGFSSLFRKTGRKVKKIKNPPYKEALIKADKRWGEIYTWQVIKQNSSSYTSGYYLAASDYKKEFSSGNIKSLESKDSIYLKLFFRTIVLSSLITFLTFVIGFPLSYMLSQVTTRISNILIIFVLLPFWTSLLVRTTSWIALLQQEGVINDFLILVGIINEEGRLAMIHNATGTVVAMTHILLPFMILPLFSVMKTIPKSYVRAAVSLGAHPWKAFWKVYFPNTGPGIGAGSILVFILAIGYYITPALVGGSSGTFISNRIAYHISNSLNWGLGAALGVILLGIVLALFMLYDRIVGIDNMKLG
ncbi:MAG: ABC transporter permease [SAR324 cluster bacterium]|jgi:putative spermidine/putrescine transport system permease protein|nr:ABC transporter permease [SAR324 cluster bacterium]RZO39474.1 MAG: ABC transporter permease [Pseudomonadota bacterium]